ncbi:uncharacterized protein LOC125097345 [Lutra lutra]|uniref:uncharacterized protein LOC125097345 n=1 Tax=Lutra lutra TaxID=9657 RepID=UPI001FD2071F|nr:uncharacterized protein LOC125097345 [Lutra lutra]
MFRTLLPFFSRQRLSPGLREGKPVMWAEGVWRLSLQRFLNPHTNIPKLGFLSCSSGTFAFKSKQSWCTSAWPQSFGLRKGMSNQFLETRYPQGVQMRSPIPSSRMKTPSHWETKAMKILPRRKLLFQVWRKRKGKCDMDCSCFCSHVNSYQDFPPSCSQCQCFSSSLKTPDVPGRHPKVIPLMMSPEDSVTWSRLPTAGALVQEVAMLEVQEGEGYCYAGSAHLKGQVRRIRDMGALF